MILGTFFKKLLLSLILGYQNWISPMLGPRCRFYPSCSHYAHSCLNKYPIGSALIKSTLRILKCHPFHPGGVDLP